MATDATKTIKYGDANIIASVREYWDMMLQEKIYARAIARNLPGAVQVISRPGQGIDKTLRWTRSQGITTTATDRYDVASTDLEMNQIEYGTEELSVTADHYAGFVAEKVDILKDQEGFVMPNIMSSLSRDLATKENELFISVMDAASTDVVTAASTTDISLVELRKGVTAIENDNLESLYILMSPNTVQTFADEMLPANTIGDNTFLRQNNVGMLFGSNVIRTTYVTDNIVYYLGEEAMRMYERLPYTLTMARDNVSDLYVKFAVEARFGFGADRSEAIKKSTFTGN